MPSPQVIKMGYNGEKASLNQYSSLYEYCKKNVFVELESLFVSDDVEQKKLEVADLPYVYSPKKAVETPLISFDGGLGTLFKGTPMEVSLIKVSGAHPPGHEKYFENSVIPDALFHVFTGGFSVSANQKSLLKKELNRLFSIDEFVEFLAIINVDFNSFTAEFTKLMEKWKEKSTIKDSFRELLEWALIFSFIFKNNVKSNANLFDFLVIKDGSLTANARSLTGAVANNIRNMIESPSGTNTFPIIGVVKNSRFVGESSIGRIVRNYASMLDSHQFFQIPKKYEAIEDKEFLSNSFERYFLSLFGGKSVYEIQIPKHISKDKEKVESIFDLIAENVTFSYGGSVSINSFAHIKASLSEAESNLLERNLYFELKNKKSGR